MKIINTEIIEENGIKYQVDIYDNGAVVKATYSDEPIQEPVTDVEEPTDDESSVVGDCLADLLLNQAMIIKKLETIEGQGE